MNKLGKGWQQSSKQFVALHKVLGKQETEWIIMETSVRDGCLHPGELNGSAPLGNEGGVNMV